MPTGFPATCQLGLVSRQSPVRAGCDPGGSRGSRGGKTHPQRRQAMAAVLPAGAAPRPMTSEEKKVIFASSLGTVFEWYDFYLYGSLAAIIAKQFFSGLDAGAAFIFALLAFAAGFLVRPFGAIVFGRLGDMIGRKYTFLVTILIMGLSTFIVGLLPSYEIGRASCRE